MITHQTERLTLTSMRPDHGPELFKLYNDPLVNEIIFNNVMQTTEDVREALDTFLAQWRKNGFGFWMLYEKVNNGLIFIGRCGLCDYEDTNNLELRTMLCEHGRGRGLGPEASRFAITHAFRNSSREKVVSVIRHGNAQAVRGAKKLGLRYIDDRRHNGKFWQYYELTRKEFFSQSEPEVKG